MAIKFNLLGEFYDSPVNQQKYPKKVIYPEISQFFLNILHSEKGLLKDKF